MLPNRPEIVFAKRSDIEAKFINPSHPFGEGQIVQIAQCHFARRFRQMAAERQMDMVGKDLTASNRTPSLSVTSRSAGSHVSSTGGVAVQKIAKDQSNSYAALQLAVV